MPPSVAVAAEPLYIRPLAEHLDRPPQLVLVRDEPVPEDRVPPGVREVHRLLTAVLEILDGRRPVAQLAEILPRRSHQRLLAACGPGPRILRSLHLMRTTGEVVDLCARVDLGMRSRALTGRLEHLAGRWHFTFLAVV